MLINVFTTGALLEVLTNRYCAHFRHYNFHPVLTALVLFTLFSGFCRTCTTMTRGASIVHDTPYLPCCFPLATAHLVVGLKIISSGSIVGVGFGGGGRSTSLGCPVSSLGCRIRSGPGGMILVTVSS